MGQQRWRVCVTGLFALIVVFFFIGCARRPVSATIAAPAPTGSGTSSQTARVEAMAPPASEAPAPVTESAPEPQSTQVEAPAPVTESAPEPQLAQVEAPAPPAPSPSERTESPPEEFRQAETLEDVHFEFDRHKLRPEDTGILDHNAAWMRANPKYIILIEGHADARGTTEYNLALGERRAGAAKNYLLGQGVPASRVTIVSYGKERPLCHERNETCWGENRRAHFLVTTQSAETAR